MPLILKGCFFVCQAHQASQAMSLIVRWGKLASLMGFVGGWVSLFFFFSGLKGDEHFQQNHGNFWIQKNMCYCFNAQQCLYNCLSSATFSSHVTFKNRSLFKASEFLFKVMMSSRSRCGLSLAWL